MSAASADRRPILISLPVSLYNEFGRWSLDACRVDYEERPQALVLHAVASRLRGGAGTTPTLLTDGKRLTDSAAIAEWADSVAAPGCGIYPRDPAEREHARALIERWLVDLGRPARRMAWGYLIDDIPTVARYWSAGVPSWQRRLMPAAMRAAKPLTRRSLGLSPEQLDSAPAEVTAVFDEVARILADGRGFLGGERFGVLDLCFAAMASPAICPTEGHPVPHYQPEDFPPEHAERILAFRQHPAGRFATRIYAEHRQPRADAAFSPP